MDIAFILGRIPQLAQQEIEAVASTLSLPWTSSILQTAVLRLKLSNSQPVLRLGEVSSLVQQDSSIASEIVALQERLGGTLEIVYLCQVLPENEVQDYLGRELLLLAENYGRKLNFGISVYGKNFLPSHSGLELKDRLRKAGHSVRYLQAQEKHQLGSAQVYHNRLALLHSITKGVEIVLIQEGLQWWVGVTLTVQNIDAYSERDFQIPFPDSLSGMLPPKLAQNLINLAAREDQEAIIYDPFCGNGRILSEAWLMGLPAIGSDVETGKVEASQKNLAWLAERADFSLPYSVEQLVWQADATQKSTLGGPFSKEQLDGHLVIAAEPYLGKPLRQPLALAEKEGWLAELSPIYLNFLERWSEYQKETWRPVRMILIFPRAKVEKGGEVSLYDTLVDRIKDLGYSSSILSCYERPDSLVARDIIQVEYSSQ